MPGRICSNNSMAVYVREPDMNKVTVTAVRILSVDPRNLRALFYVTYITKEKACLANPKDARALLDNASSEAKITLRLLPPSLIT